MLSDSYLLRRQIKQKRALATVANIAEAAVTVLTRDGAGRFTTNRVAEEADVNIASLYRYFPNKEALLLHLIHLSWEEERAHLSPILIDKSLGDAEMFRIFIREYFLIEAQEAELKRAIRAAAVDMWNTVEYREAIARGSNLFRKLIARVLRDRPIGMNLDVNFGVLLTIGAAEKSAEIFNSKADIIRSADLVSEILIARWKIC
ncbi:TetR/AcrR family transcriptional regulator [Methylobacterium sp. NPDC080182]|uniref:TetR/AcrR family transcriptional regulator n=1 Tax=Methylobacterium sp. NPDC080182 TaxID=3390590 RepID=UPI003D03B567